MADDTRLGLKSTAILFGRSGKACIGLFYALAAASWAVGGWLLGMSMPYAVGMVIVIIAAHLAWQPSQERGFSYEMCRGVLGFSRPGTLIAMAAKTG
ncbi:hypothetical protein [Xenorhabdus bovienii]|uniref:Uncharacterized protein n=1 Tax=Xenorhabdus bovienii str. feltiae Moldova TaxID=1398200 RepID=A0A077NQA1_XENBV|nr:hypothetical protein XBFM1_1260020 [Xenorhabdus bovienii str. feltiae Moldova]